MKKAGPDLDIGKDFKGSGIFVRYEEEEFVGPVFLFHLLLFDGGLQIGLRRGKPHLNKPHRCVPAVVYLRMKHTGTDSRMLDAAFFKYTALAILIGVSKTAIGAISYNFYLAVRMKRPDGTGGKGVIVEDPQIAEAHIFFVVIFAERKMPSAGERAIFNSATSDVNIFRLTDGNHRTYPIWASFAALSLENRFLDIIVAFHQQAVIRDDMLAEDVGVVERIRTIPGLLKLTDNSKGIDGNHAGLGKAGDG